MLREKKLLFYFLDNSKILNFLWNVVEQTEYFQFFDGLILREIGHRQPAPCPMQFLDSVHDPEWTPSRMDTIPNGHNPEWTPSRMDTIPNGHDPK